MTRPTTRRVFGSKRIAAAGAPFDLGGVPLAGERRPHASPRRGGGRLGRVLGAAGKKSAAPARAKAPGTAGAPKKSKKSAKKSKESAAKTKHKPREPARKA